MSNKISPLYGHGGDIWTASLAAGISADEILDFSANINPLGPPPGLFEYLNTKMPEITRYPDSACRDLQAAIRERYNPSGETLVGNGAAELIFLLLRLTAPAAVLVTAPSFMLYEKAALAAGADVHRYMLDSNLDFHLDMDDLCCEIIRLKPGLVILCNPNNPTGTLFSRDELLSAADACTESGSLLVVDEAFLEFHPGHDEITLLQENNNGIIVLRSLTKMFALPGLRLGFITGEASLLNKLDQLRDPWSVNVLAQRAGEFALSAESFTKDTSQFISDEAGRLAEELSTISGFIVYPPAANYIFIKMENMPVPELEKKLLKAGIMIRNCGNYQGLDDSYFRVAVRTPEENQKLLFKLRQALKA